MRRKPFVSVLAGLIALLAVAALLAVVALVVLLSAPDLAVAIVAVSLPFTIGAVGLLGLGLVLGPVPVATAVGGMVARRASPFTHFLVAAPLVVAMPFVPIVGWPILAVVVITGLGAWVRGYARDAGSPDRPRFQISPERSSRAWPGSPTRHRR